MNIMFYRGLTPVLTIWVPILKFHKVIDLAKNLGLDYIVTEPYRLDKKH